MGVSSISEANVLTTFSQIMAPHQTDADLDGIYPDEDPDEGCLFEGERIPPLLSRICQTLAFVYNVQPPLSFIHHWLPDIK